MTATAAPRVVLISQWPKIKNAEYELIERIRQTGFDITVVDYLGFDVKTGRCIDERCLAGEFDFAVSFHHETPKFINLPTFLWVANPLEFMHFQGNYRTALIHNLRAYDEYLYNGSDLLKDHIRHVVGRDWKDSGLSFFGSCSRKALIDPSATSGASPQIDRLFYCGVNWEAITDRTGRAHGLLEILDAKGVADFFGPKMIENVNTWDGFSSYRGEIPFDGVSIFPAMNQYRAVLALSSPAHLKSQTSSGRVIEGFAAGVPVVSDRNPHVRRQFGDLVYYFDGVTEEERAHSVLAALDSIRARPDEAMERVREAQELILRDYSYEVCLERINGWLKEEIHSRFLHPASGTQRAARRLDVFLFFHDPYGPPGADVSAYPNIQHILRAVRAVLETGTCEVRLLYCRGQAETGLPDEAQIPGLEWVCLDEDRSRSEAWSKLRLGEKVALLARQSAGDIAVFLTQFDFVQHDHLTKAVGWLGDRAESDAPALYVSGFYVNDLSAEAPRNADAILRNSSSTGLYRWSQNSIAEHQLGQYLFNRSALRALDFDRLALFDVLFPVAVLLYCSTKAVAVHRSRHLTLRVAYGYYHRYHNAYNLAAAKGFWAQHYELLSNSTHELNSLYDVFHEHAEAVAVADRIYGYDLPPPPPVDPAVYQVNRFLGRIRPIYRALRDIKNRVPLPRLGRPTKAGR